MLNCSPAKKKKKKRIWKGAGIPRNVCPRPPPHPHPTPTPTPTPALVEIFIYNYCKFAANFIQNKQRVSVYVPVIIYFTMGTNLYVIDFNSFSVIQNLCIFPNKCIRNQNWPLRNKSKDQPRIIIWRNLVVLKYPMLHTKFHVYRLFGSWDLFFKKLFTIYIWSWRPSWPSGFWRQDV